MRVQVVIPARHNSGRLPGKPLIDLDGMPMIERTWRQCIKAMPEDQVIVATDDDRIMEVCRRIGAASMMTSKDCLTGTDRVAEVARRMKADYFINVQGDEPVINPDDIKRLAAAAEEHPNDLLLGVCPLENEAKFRNPNIMKAVFRQDKRLLYISRASIPTTKSHAYVQAWRPVWIYGFPPAALAAITAVTERAVLEDIEDIESVRFLEMGYEVYLIDMSSDSIAIDTPADVDRVLSRLRGEDRA